MEARSQILISWAKANQLVAILEVHDTTGWGDESVEPAGAQTTDSAVDYWLASDILSALRGQEAFVLVNIANEPEGNVTTSTWESTQMAAVQRLREGGLQHTLVVDAPNWAQDWKNIMRDGDGATNIFNADIDKNVVFSVHMYDVYSNSDAVWDYMTKFLEKGLPLMVGEFAADHGPGQAVDEDAILDYSEQLGLGYLGWSWSGNQSDLQSLDITDDFNVNSLSPWGTRLVFGENGIADTSRLCTCFD